MTEPAFAAAAVAARDGYGRLLALLAAADGDLAAAEDALGDALERALLTWPERGVPANPEAWLLTVARNRQRDRWKSAEARHTEALDVAGLERTRAVAVLDDVDPDAVPDKRLELMLVCAHPAISRAVRTPLMLNTVLGFTAAQIAGAFSVPTATMATRLVRAKRRIKEVRLPFRIPDRSHLPDRMTALLEAVYGAYAIEWSTASSDPRPLPPEALQLAEILAALVPEDPEVRGLAALVLLSAARAPARRDDGGGFVPLDRQDPRRWDATLIERAHAHLRAAHARGSVGRFQLEAAIQAVHCARRPGDRTDWAALKPLHEGLHRLAPSQGSAVALAAVVGETDGPAAGLALLDEAAEETRRFQPAWATRAHLLARLGRREDAVAAYEKAITLTHDVAERDFLLARRSAVAESPAARRKP
ncbi:RNA polymerase sigma factor [Georgenia alba]|uniref:RNA polymerase sigma factor n=1 Tax=Georgenia alba TaxID=2233858 RepID=A0ABW2Q3I9_9MICO